MGLNSEIHRERIATQGAGTCTNVPRTCWDSVGWETRALESVASLWVRGLLLECDE